LLNVDPSRVGFAANDRRDFVDLVDTNRGVLDVKLDGVRRGSFAENLHRPILESLEELLAGEDGPFFVRERIGVQARRRDVSERMGSRDRAARPRA